MKKDIIITIDIGGTTFESAILNRDYLNIIDISSVNYGSYSIINYNKFEKPIKVTYYLINSSSTWPSIIYSRE